MSSSKKHSIWGTLLRVVVSIGALGLVLFFLRDKLAESVDVITKEVSWPLFICSLAVYAIGVALISLRLKVVFSVQKISLKLSETYYLNMLGLFFNLFFPSAVGGDIAKAFYAYKHSGKKVESTTSVILDRLMGFVALITMAVVSVIAFSSQMGDERISKVVFVAALIMILCFAFFGSKRFAKIFSFLKHLIPSERIKQRMSEVYHSIYGYKKHPATLFWTVLLSLVSQTVFIVVHIIVVRSLGVSINPWLFFILIPILSIVTMAPSIGGLGVREAATIYLFQKFMPSHYAIAMSLLLDIILYGFSFLGGILFAIKGGLRRNSIAEMETIEE